MTPPMPDVEGLLEVEGLSIRFGDRPPAVRGISFRLAAGETLGLVGESGSGKSATALAIAGLLPATARLGGRIRLCGADLAALDEAGWRKVRGRQVAIIFQDAMTALNPLMTTGAQVAEAIGAHRPVTRAVARARTLSLLAEVGLADPPRIAASRPGQLSGGQQQRVLIALALASDPALLIADEPTTALDTTVQAQVLGLLRDLQARRGMAILFVSHDLAVVAAIADRVAVMQHGAIVEEGPPATLFAAPAHPYTARLVGRHAMPPRPSAAPATAAEAAVLVENLSVEFAQPDGGRHPALLGLSCRVARGCFLGIVGESGSGKSTLARTLVGLAAPTTGRVRVGGMDPMAKGARRDFARRDFARRCQMVFQDSTGSLNPRLTIAGLLAEPFQVHRLCPATEIRARSRVLLAEVGLPADFLDRYPHQLSGGQRQRVAIARALALEPAVLICDEIVSALDATTQAQMLALIGRVAADRDLTVLFISHDLEVVGGLVDEVLVLHRGRAVESGPAASVLAAPVHAHTRALVAAMPRRLAEGSRARRPY